jgi:hypothetical protein
LSALSPRLKRLPLGLLAIAALTVSVPSGTDDSAVTHTITHDAGGRVLGHAEEFGRWSRHHDRVVIDGECYSACTLVIGASLKICATDRGVFGFHSASLNGAYADGTTLFLWISYGSRLQGMLRARGWDGLSEHPDPIFISAAQIVPRCDPDQAQATIRGESVRPQHVQQQR